MKKLFALPFLFLIILSCSTTKKENNPTKPNVLFIAVDDLNDWIEPLGGHSQAISPSLDKLAIQGIMFTNAHCSQAVCTASRNSLLSGLHPSTTGWYYGTGSYRKNYDQVMEGHQMLPEYFKNNGYNTYSVGIN